MTLIDRFKTVHKEREIGKKVIDHIDIILFYFLFIKIVFLILFS